MKTIVIGDIHGQIEVVRAAKRTGLPIVFVGDFLDSHDRSSNDCVASLLEAMEMQRAGRATVLRGNHEMSYLVPHLRCSRWHAATSAHMLGPLGSQVDTENHDFIWREGFLITHAGVSQRLLDWKGQTLEAHLEAGRFDQIGHSRGGSAICGGLWWCDFDDDFVPIPGVSQIFGHTHEDGEIREIENNWCIDALNTKKHFWDVLLIEDGQAEVVDLRNLIIKTPA